MSSTYTGENRELSRNSDAEGLNGRNSFACCFQVPEAGKGQVLVLGSSGTSSGRPLPAESRHISGGFNSGVHGPWHFLSLESGGGERRPGWRLLPGCGFAVTPVESLETGQFGPGMAP